MNIELVERPALTVTGFLVVSPWDDLPRTVPAAWRSLFERAREIHAPDSEPRYVEVSLPRENGIFHEMVGVVTLDDAPAPAGMRCVRVPANTYLHCTHEGALAGIARSFERLYAHAARAGIEATDVKLDFGYDPQFSPRRHDLFLALASGRPPQIFG